VKDGTRDDEQFSSATVDRATRLLWIATTGQDVPSGLSTRYDKYREATSALVAAAAVKAIKHTDPAEAEKK
jgi:hypothetical protein